ncbi:MAG TPA: DUF1007 family protein [Microvirga sp.]|jgi:ABC-type uncharacterized transport system substrate-binding protein|nr:DUF1007 family protein [Microvirga sp.]
MMRPIRLTVSLIAAFFAAIIPAFAHPHVFVTARAEVLYGSDGRVTGVRHAWTFDKVYTSYITQGLDTNGDGKLEPGELQDLAKENTTSLVDFEYFTVVKANGAKQAFGEPRDYGMAVANEEATLTYVLPLKNAATNKLLTVEVYDPSYFVAFTLAEGDDAVKLAGAPKGCSMTLTRPKPVDVSQQQNLSESFFEALDAASNFGSQFSNRALVACP